MPSGGLEIRSGVAKAALGGFDSHTFPPFCKKQLFTDTALQNRMVFKGGTSLSKVFGLIDRFSEDIDLILEPGGGY